MTNRTVMASPPASDLGMLPWRTTDTGPSLDLDDWYLHRTVTDVDVDGLVLPGVTGRFHRRPHGVRTASIGVFTTDDDCFAAWGYVGETHCRFHATRRADGGWNTAVPGCPVLRPVAEADGTGFVLLTPQGAQRFVTGHDVVLAPAG